MNEDFIPPFDRLLKSGPFSEEFDPTSVIVDALAVLPPRDCYSDSDVTYATHYPEAYARPRTPQAQYQRDNLK